MAHRSPPGPSEPDIDNSLEIHEEGDDDAQLDQAWSVEVILPDSPKRSDFRDIVYCSSSNTGRTAAGHDHRTPSDRSNSVAPANSVYKLETHVNLLPEVPLPIDVSFSLGR